MQYECDEFKRKKYNRQLSDGEVKKSNAGGTQLKF